MTPIENIYFASRIIHGDLSFADDKLTGQVGPTGTWIPFVKTALIALANLADLEGTLRPMYRDTPVLASTRKRSTPTFSLPNTCATSSLDISTKR